MQGQYSGFTTWLENESPGHIHTWCYAHVLNLVMKDTSETNLPSITLFGLINKCAVFFRESYRRMDTWVCQLEKSHSKHDALKRLIKANSTRWWSKSNALSRIFGQYGNPDIAVFVDLVHSLFLISSSEKFMKTTRSDALALLNNLTKFETILTAHIYLKIFQTTTPLSNYLQTSGLDFMQAHRLVRSAINDLKKQSRSFVEIFETAKIFSVTQNSKLEDYDSDVMIETSFPPTRIRTKKSKDKKETSDELPTDAAEKYKIIVFNCIMDSTTSSLEKRFNKHKELYADMSFFDPRNFPVEIENISGKNILEKITSLICQHLNENEKSEFNIDETLLKEQVTIILKDELVNFSKKWPYLKKSINEEYEFENYDSSGNAYDNKYFNV